MRRSWATAARRLPVRRRMAAPAAGGGIAAAPESVSFLSQKEARELDERLMGAEGGYSVDQLMELAGLACAVAVTRQYPSRATAIYIACGPGNNGGDGLVAARHLVQFGYSKVVVVYPATPKEGSLYARLAQQARLHNVTFADSVAGLRDEASAVVVDALFGFSFRPPLREPYAALVREINASGWDVVSVDVPTGWDVEAGPPSDPEAVAVKPAMLVSLTAPKLCAKKFSGVHFVGGRFVPPGFASFKLPDYPATEPVLRLSSL